MRKLTVVKIYDNFEEILLIFLFMILVVVIFLQVVMRYVFNNSLSWTEALGRYIFVWLSWLGVSLGAKKGEHIKISLLTQKLSYYKLHILNVISEIFLIGICGVTIYYGVIICNMLLVMNSQDSALHINPAIGYAAVPVGCSLQVFRCIQSILSSIKKIVNGSQQKDDYQPDFGIEGQK